MNFEIPKREWWKMNLIAQRWQPGLLAQQKPRRKQQPVVVPDHDLPVLSLEEYPRVHLDWDALLISGVQPALILGAERRWQGKR